MPLCIIPIVKSKNNYNFTEEEIDFINNLKKSKNITNYISDDFNILNHIEMQNIKKHIEQGIKSYVETIIFPINKELQFYITQSWCNFSNKNEQHHRHSHPNSIISGCLYVNEDKNKDSIIFLYETNKNSIINIPNIKNQFNSDTWTIPVETGDLLLFNSSLEHMVKSVESDKTRISISFNVFVKGEIGFDSSKIILN